MPSNSTDPLSAGTASRKPLEMLGAMRDAATTTNAAANETTTTDVIGSARVSA